MVEKQTSNSTKNPYAPPKTLADETVVDSPNTDPFQYLTFETADGRRNAAIVLFFASSMAGIICLADILLRGTSIGLTVSVAFKAVSVLTGIVAFVVFLTWFYRMYKNLYVLATETMRYSPAWAVGCWFVPVICFVHPRRCVWDVYNGSESRLPGQPKEDHPLLPEVWWGIWLILVFAEIVNTWTKSAALTLWSLALGITWQVLTVVIMVQISYRQKRKASGLGFYRE